MKRTDRKRGQRRARTSQAHEVERQIVQIITAAPGWHALYAEEDGPATMPLVCFALIEFREGGGAPTQLVCPMVAHEEGLIEDAQLRDGFVDLIPPCMHAGVHSHDELDELAVGIDAGNANEVRS